LKQSEYLLSTKNMTSVEIFPSRSHFVTCMRLKLKRKTLIRSYIFSEYADCSGGQATRTFERKMQKFATSPFASLLYRYVRYFGSFKEINSEKFDEADNIDSFYSFFSSSWVQPDEIYLKTIDFSSGDIGFDSDCVLEFRLKNQDKHKNIIKIIGFNVITRSNFYQCWSTCVDLTGLFYDIDTDCCYGLKYAKIMVCAT
jgi:hypothetical protein